MAKASFRGGINLPPRKESTQNSPVANVAIPHLCRYTLREEGSCFVPIVKKGQTVTEGEIIARSDVQGVPPIHASVPGRIIAVSESDAPKTGVPPRIDIEASGAFHSSAHPVKTDWQSLSGKEISEMLFEAGIPIHTDASSSTSPEYLIINAIDPEPYITSRERILIEYPEKIAEGIAIVMKGSSASRCILAVTHRQKEAARSCVETVPMGNYPFTPAISVVSSKYPQSMAPFLIRSTTGISIDSSFAAKDGRFSIISVEDLLAVHEAITESKPLYERVVTVSGSAIARPGNYKIRSGTLISHVIDECGGFIHAPSSTILGGPMTGVIAPSTDLPVSRSVSAILFLTGKEISRWRQYPCIGCGQCADVCPIRLTPFELAHSASGRKVDSDLISRCIGCNCCSAVCPSRIPLGGMITALRSDGGTTDAL
jgi:electron transport complex protein RnfC